MGGAVYGCSDGERTMYLDYYIPSGVRRLEAVTLLNTKLRAPGPISLFRLFFFSAYSLVRSSSASRPPPTHILTFQSNPLTIENIKKLR